MDMVHDALIPADEDPIRCPPGEIQRVNIPILLIEEMQALFGRSCGDDAWSRPLAVCSDTNDGTLGTRPMRSQGSMTCRTSAKLNHVCRPKRCSVNGRKIIPRGSCHSISMP